MHNAEPGYDEFWQFSCACYAHKDIALHALALQDKHDVNVNLLLLLCWCLKHGAVINLAQFRQLAQALSDSEKALVVQRRKRREMHPDNGGDEQSYNACKQQELTLEREQQRALIRAFHDLDEVTMVAADGQNAVLNASVAAFIHCYGLRDSKPARRHISTIVGQLAGFNEA
ncbi:TIGR02444 family protein [Alteromonas halophila]|uniref:TIGR02444 family protein n=1 Tax=Alteromonas halophila TaxID=516698 RepID=A0A918JN29_9ALTE|nr:TIGR02444 family protein [Alteromonas halophila]GGW90858.1 hypothetical protein GCM10007391_26450 [Alteromonas halophila]